MAIVLHNSILVVVEIDMISVLKCIKIRHGGQLIRSKSMNEQPQTINACYITKVKTEAFRL